MLCDEVEEGMWVGQKGIGLGVFVLRWEARQVWCVV